MNTTTPITLDDFTTSADPRSIPPEKLIEMAQFFKKDLSK